MFFEKLRKNRSNQQVTWVIYDRAALRSKLRVEAWAPSKQRETPASAAGTVAAQERAGRLDWKRMFEGAICIQETCWFGIMST